MLKITLIILSLLFTNISFGQKRENEIFKASKGGWEMPIKKYINLTDNYTKRKYYTSTCSGQNDSLLIITTDSAYLVKSLHKGKVILVSQIDSNSFILTVKFGDYFLTYVSLGKVFVKNNDEINAGDIIGKIGKNLDNIYELDIFLSKRDKYLCAKNWIIWSETKH